MTTIGRPAAIQTLNEALTAPTTSSVLDSNAGWSWFSSPEAICYAGSSRKMYTGFIRGVTNYDVVVASYDLDTHALTEFTLAAAFERDDHDNPGICVLGDGRLLVCYVKHNDATGVRYRISTNPEDISAWGSEQVITSSGTPNTSYANPYRMANGHIYVFYRGNGGVNSFSRSTDEGATWSGPYQFIVPVVGQRPYVRYHSDGATKLHFFATGGHPRDMTSGTCDLYHGYIDTSTGAVHKSDGTQTKTLATIIAGTPLAAADMTLVYDASVEGSSFSKGGNGWVWSIALDSNARPVVTYAAFPTSDAHRYFYGRWDGSQWVKNVVVSNAGPSLYGLAPQAEEQYSAGVAVDPSDTRVVWLAIQDATGNKSELWKYRTLDGGSSWESVRVTSGSETIEHYRPVPPRNKLSGAPDILWNAGTYGNFASWNAALKAAPAL